MTIALLACHFAGSFKYEVYRGDDVNMIMVDHGNISDITKEFVKKFHVVTTVEHWHMSDDNTLRMWI